MAEVRYGWIDFKNHFKNIRLLVFCIFQYTILHMNLDSVKAFVQIADYPASPWILPFVCTNVYFLLVYAICVVYFYSDIPFLQKSQMYVMVRQGKQRWIITKIVRIWIAAFFLTAVEFLLSIIVLLPRIEWVCEWGKLYYSIAITNAGNDYNILLEFPYEIINMGSPVMVTGMCMLVMFVVTGMTGMMMFVIGLAVNRTSSIFVGSIFAIFTIVFANVYRIANWFVYITPFSWINLLVLYGKDYMQMLTFRDVIFIGAAAVVVFALACRKLVWKKNLMWIEEEE